MKKQPVAIFDMDGTLLDSMYYWDRAPSCVLESLGVLPDDEMEAEFKRLGFDRIPKYVAERFPELCTAEAFSIRVDAWMLERYRGEVLPKPSVRQYLEKLRRDGVRCIILTASDTTFIDAMLRRFRMEDFFCATYSARRLGMGKSSAAVYDYLCQQLDCGKEDLVLFDDAPYAATVAAAAGVRTVGILDPLFPEKHPVLREVCTRTVSRYTELIENDIFSAAAP